jgi:hypothetical protein
MFHVNHTNLNLLLLEAINDINPSIKLGDEGINSVLVTLQSIRERALSACVLLRILYLTDHFIACRACVYALHAEITRLLELQHAFRQLSYFDVMGRSRLTIKLTRVTLSLPFALEKALLERRSLDVEGVADKTKETIFPRRVTLLIRGVDIALERMESILS